MSKKFSIKFYDKSASPIKTVNPLILLNEPSFTQQINGGQGECILRIKASFDNFAEEVNFIGLMNHVQVVEIDPANKDGRVIFTGYVPSHTAILKNAGEYIQIRALGLASKLSESLYGVSPDFTVNSTADPSALATAVIDSLLVDYPNFITYATSGPSQSVFSVGTDVNLEFTQISRLEAIQKSRELAGGDWYWYIDGQGVFHFAERPATATHVFQIGNDIESIEVDNNINEMVNHVVVNYDGGQHVALDSSSITEYGRRAKVIDDSSIKDLASAQLRASDELTKATPKLSTKITINSNYDLESIRPGQTCRVRGLKEGSTTMGQNMQIMRVKYQADKVELVLDEFQSLAGAIKKVV